MSVDYYGLLKQAVAGKDSAGRNQIYTDAYNLIKNSTVAREVASSHATALADAIRKIEDEIASEDARSQADVSKTLAAGRNWKPVVAGVGALIAIIAVSALLYDYFAIRGSRPVASQKATPAREDMVITDLQPGADGGSTGEGLPFAMQRQVVFYRTTVVPGSIVIDRENRFLYLIDVNSSARRYGIGIAQECLKGGSLFRVANKLEWPVWPSSDANLKETDKLLGAAGRPGSPLGARALLLDKPGLLIHGTNSPLTIGHLVTSGCIRLVNDDVEDLYRRVSVETRVVFIS
jgi:lipoprotein-anchoring transpeptidase ErfK/SrfK